MRQKRAKDKRINARKKAHGRQTRQRARKPAQKRQNTKAGNKAAGRRTCGKPHAQPPGGGTSLHPGAASQTGQTAAAKAPHTQAHGGRTAGSGSAGQTKPDTKAAGCPQARNKAAAHRQKKRRGTGRKSPHNSGRFRKNGRPGRRRGALDAEKTPPNGKIRVRSFACPEGPCEPGPPKNASLFWLARSSSASHCAQRRAAQNKRGRRPLLSPASFLKKA